MVGLVQHTRSLVHARAVIGCARCGSGFGQCHTTLGRIAGTKHLAFFTGVVGAGKQFVLESQGLEFRAVVTLQVGGVQVLDFELGATA